MPETSSSSLEFSSVTRLTPVATTVLAEVLAAWDVVPLELADCGCVPVLEDDWDPVVEPVVCPLAEVVVDVDADVDALVVPPELEEPLPAPDDAPDPTCGA